MRNFAPSKISRYTVILLKLIACVYNVSLYEGYCILAFIHQLQIFYTNEQDSFMVTDSQLVQHIHYISWLFLCVVDCGPPVAPQRGSLESYTDTTEGSEVFYRCDPGLVPEGRMRAVCTRSGWSPNPSDLRCAGVFYIWEQFFHNCAREWGNYRLYLSTYTDSTCSIYKAGICTEFL